MPRLRSRSIHTPTTQIPDSATRKTSRPKTVSLAEKRRKPARITANNVDEKITPTRENGRSAKMSGDWEEEDIEETVADEVLPRQKIQKTPDRRSTFDLETSINNIEILKRDSLLEKTKNGLRNCNVFKKKKRTTENRNLRKKVNLLLETTTPPSKLDFSAVNKTQKDDSVIEISSESSAANTPELKKEIAKQKIDLLKHTLSKKFNAKVSEISCPKKVLKKMPDFAAIHKKRFAQMEDIATMAKRKEERAKLLLSGSKPSPLKPRNHNTDAIKAKLFPESVQSTPKVRFTPETRGSPLVQFTLPKTPKPTPAAQSYKDRRKTKEGYTRYGFKKIPVAVKQVEKNKQQVAVVATKSNASAASSSKEKRKEMLKGVRTNRRFELLMAMRKGQN